MANNTVGIQRYQAKLAAAAAVIEARENLQYWKCQKAIRVRAEAKAEAGALVLVWEYNLQTREAKLAALSLATA